MNTSRAQSNFDALRFLSTIVRVVLATPGPSETVSGDTMRHGGSIRGEGSNVGLSELSSSQRHCIVRVEYQSHVHEELDRNRTHVKEALILIRCSMASNEPRYLEDNDNEYSKMVPILLADQGEA